MKVGTIGWVDLTVENADALRDFYQQVAGWTCEPVDMGGYADYTMKPDAGADGVAGICHSRGVNVGLPPTWLIYIVVEDLAAALQACRDGGGSVVYESPQMPMAVIRDPAGAHAALYQATPDA